MKLLTQEKNDVFGRIDSVFQVSYSGVTPDRNFLKEDIAKQLKTKSDLLVIRKIETKFGKSEAVVYVTSYNDKKDLETLEFKHLIAKNNKEIKKEESKEEVSKEEVKVDVPEEKKEESTEEVSKEEVKVDVPEEKKEESTEEVGEPEEVEE